MIKYKEEKLYEKANGQLVFSVVLSLPLPAAYAATEGTKSDIQGHWAEKQLVVWIGKGLIKGYGDGSFKPDGAITRAEFMALVNRSFGLNDNVRSDS